MADYGIRRDVNAGYDDILSALPEAFSAEGFGVLTEIDVKATFKKKLDLDFRRYKILGVCNPHLAHRALTARIDVGLMLPCNVVVYETDEGATILVIDPLESVGRAGAPELEAVAHDAREKLSAALDRLVEQLSA